MSKFPKIFLLTKFSQFGKDFYMGNIKFSQLKDLYKFSIRSDENLDGFNRTTDEKKINSIAEFISKAEKNSPNYPLFVTPIILGISTDGEKIKLSSGNESQLEINEQLEDSFKALVVDGQHRLKGIEKWVGGEFSQNDIQIPVVFLLDYSEYELAEIFANVNFTQKPVNKSLYYDIFGASPFMPISEIRIAHVLLKNVNEKFKNDFQIDFIKMLPNSSGTISQGFFGDKLVKLLNKSFRYRELYLDIEQKYRDYEKDSIQEYEIEKDMLYQSIQIDFISYFIDVQNNFGNQGVIFKTNGIGALLLLLEDFHLFGKYEYDTYFKSFDKKNIFKDDKYKNGSESIQKQLYREISKDIFFKQEIEKFNEKEGTVVDIKNYKLKSYNIVEGKRVLEINKRLFKFLFDEGKISYEGGGLYKVIG